MTDTQTSVVPSADAESGLARDLVPLALPEVDRIFESHYDELRRLAHVLVRRLKDPFGHRTTSLLHEAYSRLAQRAGHSFRDHGHLVATITRAMRFAMIDRLRRGRRDDHAKRDLAQREESTLPGEDLLALDAALEELAAIDARKARVIEMRFFGGLSVEETALALGVAEPTVKRDFAFARAWLLRALTRGDGEP